VRQDDRVGAYRETYRASIEDPEGFWGAQAGLIDWISMPSQVLDRSRPPFYRWFPGGLLNT
jgi:propionyl-CoA synthetase